MAKERGDKGAGPAVTVVNNSLRIRRYPVQTVPARFKDMSPDRRRVDVRAVELKPGAQEVPGDRWKLVEGLVASDVEDGTLRVLEKPIYELSELQALRIIRETIDKPILLAAQMKEKRPKVLKALGKQLKAVSQVAHDPQEASG